MHEIIPHFPQEIAVEILLRLPVKSLLKFRCVSKSWLRLISSSNFIKAHLKNSTKSQSYTRCCRIILFTVREPPNDCSLHSLFYNPVTDAIDIEYPVIPPWNTDSTVSVVGSCNGLVCVQVDIEFFFLWNPTTGISKKLPDSGMSGDRESYGFGFDELNDDYKVVKIFRVANTSVNEEVIMIYSLKNDTWKQIGNFGDMYLCRVFGKYVNGKLHWFNKLPTSWNIVSVDLNTEMVGTLDPPNYDDDLVMSLSLSVLDGCLCVFENCWSYGNIWILKEYGLKQSWTKVASINIPEIDEFFRQMGLEPLYMINSGEILFLYEMFVVVYNPKDNSIRFPRIDNLTFSYEAIIYVESLVSPILDDGLRGQLQGLCSKGL